MRSHTTRYRCRDCDRTFYQTAQALYYRPCNSQIKLKPMTMMSVEGLSRATIARVECLARTTVDRWLDRAADAAQQFNDQLIRNVALQELQADGIQTVALDKG